jgi:exopolysaccharide biosynthesis polyprenyl glycosylphosphotransferase
MDFDIDTRYGKRAHRAGRHSSAAPTAWRRSPTAAPIADRAALAVGVGELIHRAAPVPALTHAARHLPITAPSERPQGHRGSLLVGRMLGPGAWPTVRLAVDLAMLSAASLAAWAGASRAEVGARDAWLAMIYPLLVLAVMRGRQAPSGSLNATSLLDACAHVIAVCSLAAMLTIATGSIVGGDRPVAIVLRLWLFSVVYLDAARVTLSWIERHVGHVGAVVSPTLVVGAGVVGEHIVRRLQDRPEYGLRPVGFLDANPPSAKTEVGASVPVLGGPDDLAEVAQRMGARHVILAFSFERDHRLIGLVTRCRELGMEISVVPRLYESINDRATLKHIGDLPLLSLCPIDTSGWRFTVKHVLDRVFALLALIALAPVLLVIALAVRVSSPGPVIFRQRRVGRDGRTFELLKFRTMVKRGVGEDFGLLDGVAPGGIERDDRRTRLGRWLRSTSLDECPQFFNVLRGEMSLVGPRPERPEFAARFAHEVNRYEDRHRVKPGITGWAQVNGLRGQTSIADRVEWDNYYIQNWSLGLELRIVALTAPAVMRFHERKQPSPGPVGRSGSAGVRVLPARWTEA